MAGKGEGGWMPPVSGNSPPWLITYLHWLLKFFMSCKLRICNDIFYILNKCCFWIMPSQAICIT